MVDLVVAFVNNKDTTWQHNFIKYCREHNLRQYIHKIYNERYNGTCWLPYQLKLVRNHMPFINKIFLVVSNKEQLKGIELYDNVVVVEHESFIPKNHLPTFNSTTIELFIPLIKDLCEKFIYANDDMLPTQMLQECNFYENDKIKINWLYEKVGSDTQFKKQCENNVKHLKTLFENESKIIEQDTYIRPYHSMTPMIKSHCLELYYPLYDLIKDSVSAFRTDININQYIYPIYEYIKYGTLPSDIDFLYTELKESVDLNHQIICVNNEIEKDNAKEFIMGLEKLCE